MNADAIVVLPGGAGTLDELFEALTWAQLGLHDKPILLVDAGGFWAPLLGLMAHLQGAGFVDPAACARLERMATPAEALSRLDAAAAAAG